MNIDRLLRLPFVKYAIVGGFGTALHFGALILLVELAGMRAVAASAIGFVLVVVVSYFLNRHWTFASASADSALGSFAKYAAVSTSGLLLNTAVMYAVVDLLGGPYLLGQAAVTLLVPVSNYYFNRTWTFKPASTAHVREGGD